MALTERGREAIESVALPLLAMAGALLLCAAVVLKYAFGMGAAVAIWGPIHGALFVIYVIIAFDLAYKDLHLAPWVARFDADQPMPDALAARSGAWFSLQAQATLGVPAPVRKLLAV